MADISSIVLPTSLTAEGLSPSDARQLKSYLYQLTEQLRYVLANLDSDNMSASYNAGISAAGVQIAQLTEAQRADIEALRQNIVHTASRIAHDYQSAIEQSESRITTQVEEAYTARSESLQASMESLVASQVSQTSRELQLSLTEASTLARETADALEQLTTQTETWFRFTMDGLEIGASENGAASAYTLRIDNEKLAFLRYGAEVASLRYNRLYITAAEISDRLSIGGSAGEGYFDLITTATGLGVKWRAN